MTSISQQHLATIRGVLVRRLADLQGRGIRIDGELGQPVSADADDAATEREDDEPLQGAARVLAREAAEVAAAVVRIDAGTYGDCTRCGEAIAPARLEAEPEAALCIGCARETAAGA